MQIFQRVMAKAKKSEVDRVWAAGAEAREAAQQSARMQEQAAARDQATAASRDALNKPVEQVTVRLGSTAEGEGGAEDTRRKRRAIFSPAYSTGVNI